MEDGNKNVSDIFAGEADRQGSGSSWKYNTKMHLPEMEPEQRSQYSDWTMIWKVWGLNAGRGDFYLLLKCPRLAVGPPCLLFNGYRGCFYRVSRSGREFKHLSSLMPRV